MFLYDIDKIYEVNTIILGPRLNAAGPFQLRVIARITTLKDVFRREISICGICEDVLVAGIKELEGIDSYARLHAFSLRNGEFDNQMLCAFEKVIRVAYDRCTHAAATYSGPHRQRQRQCRWLLSVGVANACCERMGGSPATWNRTY